MSEPDESLQPDAEATLQSSRDPGLLQLARRIWNDPVTRIVVYVLMVLLVLFGLVAPYQAMGHALNIEHARAFAAVGNALEPVAVLLPFWIMVRFAERRRMRDAGFSVRGVVTETVSGYLIGMAVISVCIGMLAVLGVYHALSENAAYRPWFSLLAFLMVGIAEETVFRGYAFRVLEYRYGSLIALIGSSVFFGLAHLANPSGPAIPLLEKLAGPIFITFEAGLLLTAAYIATRRLWLPIGIHWAWNFFEGPVYGTDVSGTSDRTHSLIRSSLHGPFLLTGGTFGPEASVVCLIVCTIAGLALLRIAVRSGQWKPGFWQPQSLPKYNRSASGE